MIEPKAFGTALPEWLLNSIGDDYKGFIWEAMSADVGPTLFRGTQPQSRASVLVAAHEPDREAPCDSAALEREHALQPVLSHAWAAVPLALLRRRGHAALMIEDPGGYPLTRMLGRTFDVQSFFDAAIPVATGLAAMHQSGLVHRDIKPANLLINIPGAEAHLTGFGHAIRAMPALGPPVPADRPVGTLAYMSPEQTGRMNRSVDSRSDLYSLGVTLYLLLTGELPFDAADPLELLHSHIARRPVPPADLGRIPRQLSSLVLKLLEKSPDDRYQSATDLAVDLRRCLDEWKFAGDISDFALGARYSSSRLRLPQRLYGREREVAALLAPFKRVVTDASCEMAVVAGFSGVGKSALVQEVQRVLAPSDGLFASGKFDQLKRDIPYLTLAEAFRSLVRAILTQSDERLQHWRRSLRQALGTNGQLMVDLVPELEAVIGPQPAVTELGSAQAQERFLRAFRSLVTAFSRPEHPLVLFLDDLQWIDAATLSLLQHLATHEEIGHLFIVGAYRDNEVGLDHPVATMLTSLRADRRASLTEIALAPLSLDDVADLIGDTFRCSSEVASPLAAAIQQKTGGNPFYTTQFLTELAEQGLISVDDRSGQWAWDLDRIRGQGFGDNVVDLMLGKLDRLSVGARRTVVTLACLGGRVSTQTLAAVHETACGKDEEPLAQAVRAGLVVHENETFRFVHDKVQEAAYGLLANADRAATHLRIGRKLAEHFSGDRMGEAVFEVVNQFERGKSLVTAQRERDHIAELYFLAGKRAKGATAFAAALGYLGSALALLASDAWESRHAFSFDVHSSLAECEFLTGNLDSAEQRLLLLSRQAASLVDQASVTWLQVTLYTAVDRSDRAIELCLGFLRQVGIEWPPSASKAMAQDEYAELRRQLGDTSIESLIDLPLLADPMQRAVLDVLTAVLPPAFFSNENLVCLVLCRMANLSLRYGNSDASPLAYAYLGMVVGPHFQDYRAALSFGKLGLDLVERPGLERYRARVYHTFGSHVMPWAMHVREAPPLLRRAFDAAGEVGDMTYGGFSSVTLITSRLVGGEPLESVQSEAESRLAFARTAKFGLIVDIITSQLRLVRAMRGLLPDFSSFNDAEFKELEFERHLSENKSLTIAECWYWIRKMQARFMGGNFSDAVAASARAQQLIWISSGFFEFAEFHFCAALVHAARHDEVLAEKRAEHLSACRSHLTELQVWANTCPENFGCRVALINAEIARLEGRNDESMRDYETAIQLAKKEGFIHLEALAYELASRHYASCGLETVALALLRSARDCYALWGAHGKVRQLVHLEPRLADAAAIRSPMAASANALVHMDLDTVVKAIEAVSGEAGLPKLIDTLMVIAMEHAGAQRGLLILPKGNQLQIGAEATTGQHGIEVTMRHLPVNPLELPESILHFVMRTQTSVLLDDALRANDFSHDDYFARHRCRSPPTRVRTARLCSTRPVFHTPGRSMLSTIASTLRQARYAPEPSSTTSRDGSRPDCTHGCSLRRVSPSMRCSHPNVRWGPTKAGSSSSSSATTARLSSGRSSWARRRSQRALDHLEPPWKGSRADHATVSLRVHDSNGLHVFLHKPPLCALCPASRVVRHLNDTKVSPEHTKADRRSSA